MWYAIVVYQELIAYTFIAWYIRNGISNMLARMRLIETYFSTK